MVNESLMIRPMKWYKNLGTMKGRLDTGRFLVEGERAIRQLISSHPDDVEEIIAVEGWKTGELSYRVRIVTESQLRSISQVKTPQGIIALVRLPLDTYSAGLPGSIGSKILLLEDIQDPGNVGTLIRTAVAFGFSGVILTQRCADPFSSKCIQSSAGTVLSVWIRRTPNYLEVVKLLRKKGYVLFAADLDGTTDLAEIGSEESLVLALGNEAWGLSESILHESSRRFAIPIHREKTESLNVAVCGAICMYLSSGKC